MMKLQDNYLWQKGRSILTGKISYKLEVKNTEGLVNAA